MALEGTLRDVGLSDIFQLILLQKRTGVLTIFRAKEVVTVSFENGHVVFADEFQRSEQERLGAVLLKSKLITPQQLLQAVELQRQTLQKLGFILVNNGFLSQEQLRKALQMQVRETVFKLFRWEDGQFKFSQEPVAYDQNFYGPLPSDFLVMEGIRRIDEWPLIKKKIPSMEIIFDLTEEAVSKVGEAGEAGEQDLDDILSFVDDGGLGKAAKAEDSRAFKLSSSERVVFSLADGHRTVQDLVDEGRIGEFETCKALYSLLSLGLIRKVGEAAPAATGLARVSRPRVSAGFLRGLAVAAGLVALAAVNPLSPLRLLARRATAAVEVGRTADALRVEKIKFALLCHYQERKAYPSSLNELVSARFLEPAEIRDHGGEEFSYLREKDGYSIRSAPAGRGEGR